MKPGQEREKLHRPAQGHGEKHPADEQNATQEPKVTKEGNSPGQCRYQAWMKTPPMWSTKALQMLIDELTAPPKHYEC